MFFVYIRILLCNNRTICNVSTYETLYREFSVSKEPVLAANLWDITNNQFALVQVLSRAISGKYGSEDQLQVNILDSVPDYH